jgi:hypothetical protein
VEFFACLHAENPHAGSQAARQPACGRPARWTPSAAKAAPVPPAGSTAPGGLRSVPASCATARGGAASEGGSRVGVHGCSRQ